MISWFANSEYTLIAWFVILLKWNVSKYKWNTNLKKRLYDKNEKMIDRELGKKTTKIINKLLNKSIFGYCKP